MRSRIVAGTRLLSKVSPASSTISALAAWATASTAASPASAFAVLGSGRRVIDVQVGGVDEEEVHLGRL